MEIQQAIELKACPFCGGEAQAIYASNDYNRWGVCCKNCSASVEVEEWKGVPDTKENAAIAWNKRTEQQHQCECKCGAEARAFTVEELREYNGKPVWVECGGDELFRPEKRWCIAGFRYVHYNNDKNNEFMYEAFIISSYRGLDVSEYGKTWIAYDRQPNEESQ